MTLNQADMSLPGSLPTFVFCFEMTLKGQKSHRTDVLWCFSDFWVPTASWGAKPTKSTLKERLPEAELCLPRNHRKKFGFSAHLTPVLWDEVVKNQSEWLLDVPVNILMLAHSMIPVTDFHSNKTCRKGGTQWSLRFQFCFLFGMGWILATVMMWVKPKNQNPESAKFTLFLSPHPRVPLIIRAHPHYASHHLKHLTYINLHNFHNYPWSSVPPYPYFTDEEDGKWKSWAVWLEVSSTVLH